MNRHKKTIKFRYRITLILILLTALSSFAQHKNYFFEISGGSGWLYPHDPALKPIAGQVSILNARLGLKTLGNKDWQRTFKYPEIGIGISHNYLTKSYLGNPTAAFVFLNLPIFPETRLKINFGINAGLAWGINKFSGLNPENLALGSKCAAYANFNFNTLIDILPRLEFVLYSGLYHYSNGNTNKPNKGINIFGAEAGLRYKMAKFIFEKNVAPVPPAKKQTSIIVFGAMSWKKESTWGPFYKAGSLSIGYYRTIGSKSRLSAGADLFYDEGALEYTFKDKQLKNVMASGIFAGHELTLDRFAIVSQAGIYLSNPNPNDPFYYERVGLRYTATKRVIPSITLKAHQFKIDFIEWGIGLVLWKSN